MLAILQADARLPVRPRAALRGSCCWPSTPATNSTPPPEPSIGCGPPGEMTRRPPVLPRWGGALLCLRLSLAVAFGLELRTAHAAQDQPAGGLLGGDADGALGVAAADQLGAVEGLAALVLAAAVALGGGAGVGLAAAGGLQPPEGVQVQGDRGVQLADRVGVEDRGHLGEPHLAEPVDRVGLGVGWPFEVELGGQLDEAAVVVLALAAGVLDPAGVGERVGGLVQDRGQGVGGAFGEALAGDEQLRLAVGRDVEAGVVAGFGWGWGGGLGAAGDPAFGAEVAPGGIHARRSAVLEAGAGDEHDLGQVGVVLADGGPGVLQGGDEAGAGGGGLGHGGVLAVGVLSSSSPILT